MESPLFRTWMSTVSKAPSAVAVIDADTGKKWSRAALAKASAEWAENYRSTVPRPWRRRVVMSVPNGGDWFCAFMGLLSAGAIPAPIDPSEPEEAQATAARAIGATHIWRGGAFHRVAGPMPRGRIGRPLRNECLVKLTSGSSGTPKGLYATHAQMAADGGQVCSTMDIGPRDSNLATVPLGYSYGLGNLVLPLMLQGTRVVCASSVLPHALAADISRFRPTVLATVPPVLRALAASGLGKESLNPLRLVISAGSALQPGVAEAFLARFGRHIHGFYGTSETGGIAFDRTGEATTEGRSVGTPLDGVSLSLGARGAFTVSSRAVLGGGRFSPSDRGRLDRNGELVLLGRSDRMVKLAGRRVDLAEIERALKSLPGVREALAYAWEGPDPVLAAAALTDLRPVEIRRSLRLLLAPWKIPGRIVALPTFPVTARGKTDVPRLRQVLMAPRTATSISTLSADRQMSARR